MDVDTKGKEEIIQPSKRWFNWWMARNSDLARDVISGRLLRIEPGQVYSGDTPHPSKEIAEQRAIEHNDWNERHANGRLTPKYLCALPEGERP